MQNKKISKNGIFEIIENEGFKILDSDELKFLIGKILGIKIKKIELKYLIEKGVNKKDALLFIAGYELGKRDFFSFSQR